MWIEIAKARFPQFPIVYIDGKPRHQYPHRNNDTGPLENLDLDTLWMMEDELTEHEGGEYDMHLWLIIKRDVTRPAVWHATAEQKAEAWLKVKGLWR